MATDSLLAAAVEAMDRSGLSPAEALQQAEEMEQHIRAFTQQKSNEKTGSNVRSLLPLAAAITIVIAVGIGLWWNSSQGYEPYQLMATTVRSNTAEATELEAAFELYREEQYAQAEQALKLFPEDHPQIELILLLRGNALLALHQPESAAVVLDQLLANKAWVLYRMEARRASDYAYAQLDDG
ncbi:MAG: hypothetical protein ACFB10_10600 [Salibacteraceae bacterium]